MCSVRHPQLTVGSPTESRHPGMSREQADSLDTHQNKVWWQEESGRVFSKQPSSRGEQVARVHPSWQGAGTLRASAETPEHIRQPASSLTTCLTLLQRFRFLW